jgi:hypothetical protein
MATKLQANQICYLNARTAQYLRRNFGIPVLLRTLEERVIGFSAGNVWLIESTQDNRLERAKKRCQTIAKEFKNVTTATMKMPLFAIVTWKDLRREPRVFAAYMPKAGRKIVWMAIDKVLPVL